MALLDEKSQKLIALYGQCFYCRGPRDVVTTETQEDGKRVVTRGIVCLNSECVSNTGSERDK